MMTWEGAMERARSIAETSPDPSKKNGALLFSPTDGIIGLGVNDFPFRVRHNERRWERPTKYLYVEHAERNAIYQAARHGNTTDGATLVCVWAACADCARAIIQAGIVRLVRAPWVIDPMVEGAVASGKRWAESIVVGDQMMREAGVEIVEIA